MIKPAQLYQEELKKLYYNTFYDEKYMYYQNWIGTQELEIHNENYNFHEFAILENNEVIGYIKYRINWIPNSIDSFSIISFKKSFCFGLDLLKIIDDIFIKYKINKIEFRAIADNPVIKHYYNFIKIFNGREVGTLFETVKLSDGELHNEVLFELFRDNYINAKNNRNIKTTLKNK